MFRNALARIRDQWMGALALFLVVAGGTAYAANTVGSSDVIDNSLLSADLANNKAVRGADVVNGQLDDIDVGKHAFQHFTANIGLVPAQSCVHLDVTGIDAQGDHLLVTPNYDDNVNNVIYAMKYRTGFESAKLEACNPTAANINVGTSHFNLLVIDAT